MKFNIIVDSGFWIDLYSPRGGVTSAEGIRIASEIENENIIIPYPTLYEFVDSRLSRRPNLAFEKDMQKPNIIRLNDLKYRKHAFNNFFIKHKFGYEDISLVDEVIKLIIIDPKVKIDYIVTYDDVLLNEALSRGVRAV